MTAPRPAVLQQIADEAAGESPLWAASLRPPEEEGESRLVFSPLAARQYALGLETIYEAYLVHYGRSRLFAATAEGESILLGDYLYAHGLVRIARAGGVRAVVAMAELLSTCAALRAAGGPGDGEAWLTAARELGGVASEADVSAALAEHSARVES